MNVEYIIEQYTKQKKSLREIAREFGCTHIRIRDLLNKNGIETEHKRVPKTLVKVVCKNCNKEFERYSGILNKETFCSKRCYHTYRNNHKLWKGTQSLWGRVYAALRQDVLKRFPECVLCGSKTKLHIHHIYPRREKEELSYVLDNLITLCRKCHCAIRGKEYRYVNYFSGLVSKSGELLETPNVKSRAISNQAIEGKGSMEGSETMMVSPNNNPSHECPTRKGRYSPSFQETERTMVQTAIG